MSAKTIALDPETYTLLRGAKRPGDSFSDVIRRQLRPPSRISDLAGALKEVPANEWKQIERTRRAARRRDERRRRAGEGRRSQS
jgi:predicted CopG family antitoxin